MHVLGLSGIIYSEYKDTANQQRGARLAKLVPYSRNGVVSERTKASGRVRKFASPKVWVRCLMRYRYTGGTVYIYIDEISNSISNAPKMLWNSSAAFRRTDLTKLFWGSL